MATSTVHHHELLVTHSAISGQLSEQHSSLHAGPQLHNTLTLLEQASLVKLGGVIHQPSTQQQHTAAGWHRPLLP
jgi:hypothetical protein